VITDRPIFTLRLEGKPGQAGIHDLRALLKRLLRQHGLVCIDAREDHSIDQSQPEEKGHD
jgi:hypothetical protein